MSDQTPNSSENLSGTEPSMEDILASIRKIISDDEPVAMASPEDMTVQPVSDMVAPLSNMNLTSDAEIAEDTFDVFQSAEGESVDLNIDDVLAGLEADVLEASPIDETLYSAPIETPAESNADIFELDTLNLGSEDDILSFIDEDIPLTPETVTPVISAGAASLSKTTFTVDDDADMDALLDDILMAPDLSELDTDVLEPAAEADVVASSPEPALSPKIGSVRAEAEEDLDLVKSLMADLADDPDGMGLEDDLDALLAIPEIEEPDVQGADVEDDNVSEDAAVDFSNEATPISETAKPEFVDEPFEAEEDILGDILDMTLEDELMTQPADIDLDEILSSDDIAGFEEINIEENLDTTSEDSRAALELDAITDFTDLEGVAEDISDSDFPSLSEIAAAAEADAVAAETSAFNPLTAIAGVTAAGAGLAALSAKPVVEPDLPTAPLPEVVTPSVLAVDTVPAADPILETQTPTPDMPSQETSMPVHAVNTDAILDEVTESAAAGAFAKLNTVVEDKAIFNERGPRIGDLVQEALRPMLKDWLDANLKGIVERAVAKEVKRISTGK